MKLSSEFKIVIGILLILLLAVVSNVYHIDFNKYLSNYNSKISNNSNTTKKIKVELVSCIDGDTAKFKENNITHTYRFLGINTKEYKNEKYGYEASNYTCKSLKEANNIYVSYEKTSVKYDKYNRHLVWVFTDDDLLQEKLLKNGLAEVKYIYTKLTYIDRLYKAEKIAKKNRLNIFENYKEKNYSDSFYTVVFKIDNITKDKNVKEGTNLFLINNPKKDNKIFSGWLVDGNLYDFSKPITKDLIVTALFIDNER